MNVYEQELIDELEYNKTQQCNHSNENKENENQIQYINLIGSIDHLINIQEQKLTALKEHKQGLIQLLGVK